MIWLGNGIIGAMSIGFYAVLDFITDTAKFIKMWVHRGWNGGARDVVEFMSFETFLDDLKAIIGAFILAWDGARESLANEIRHRKVKMLLNIKISKFSEMSFRELSYYSFYSLFNNLRNA